MLVVALLAGCSNGSSPTPTPAPSGSAPTASSTGTAGTAGAAAAAGSVVVLTRDGVVDRERGFDQRIFDDQLTEACATCEVTHEDAEGEFAKQTEQLSALVGTDVDVVVLDPVDPLTVATFVQQLRDYGTKVIVIGPAVEGADFRIAFDDEAVGTDQARALLHATGAAPALILVNGSPADATAVTTKTAVHAVLDGSRASIAGEYDDLRRPRALRAWLGTLLTYYPPSTLGGIYAADDRLAAQVLAALRRAGATNADLPPITGAGAELSGVRRVLAGTQLMTVYRPLGPGSERAAEVAAALLTGSDPGDSVDVGGVATVLLDPVSVTAEDIADTVVADGYWSAERLCTKRLAKACRKAGVD
jgi:D-xylose transport system substrate-binding protein